MIEFQEIYSVEHHAMRYYRSEDGKFRFIPMDLKNYNGRIFGYVLTPSGTVFPDTLDIWQQYGIEFITWDSPDGTVSVEFWANCEEFLEL